MANRSPEVEGRASFGVQNGDACVSLRADVILFIMR